MKKILKYSFIGLAALCTALLCGGYYMLGHALNPDELITRSRNSQASYEYMFGQYPELKPWVDSLQTAGALRDFYIKNDRGETLHALYVAAAEPTRKTAVIVHGYTDNSIRMLNIGYLYNRQLKYNILLPDLHGHGASEGAEIEMLNLKNREKVIKTLLQPIRDEYDYILIDCSPSLGLITVNSLTAADSVIIPVQCEYFALEGISKLLNTIKIIKSKLNPKLEIEGFLLTMYDSRLRLANQIYDEVKRHFQELVFKTVIQRNVKLSESPSHGLPVILYDAESNGAKNHLALAKEIINKNS